MKQPGISFPRMIPSILRIGTPLLAGNLSMYLYRLADALMISRLGVTPLAAIAVATIYTSVHEMFLWPIGLGTQALVARRFGRAEHRGATGDVGELLPQGLYAGIIAGISVLIVSFAAPWFVHRIAPNVADEALSYVEIARWAFPLMGVAAGFRGFLASVHRTGAVMVGVVSSNVINILLNAVFIYGLLGAPALGVRGAAVGTVGAHALNLLVLGGYALLHRDLVRYREGVSKLPRWIYIKRILIIAAPVAIQNAFAMAVILVYQSLLARIGTMYQAVTHVIFSTFRLNKALVGGFANGASILVGNALGRSNEDEALAVVRGQQTLAAVIGSFVFVFVVAAPHLLGRAFHLEGAAATLSIEGFRFFAPFFLVEVLAYSIEIIFTHNGWGRFVLFSEVTTNLLGIVGITALSVFVFPWGYRGAWVGFAVYQGGHALLLWTSLLRRRWLRVNVEVQHGT